VRYLTLSELIYINGRLLNNAQIMSGKRKVRDVELLAAAVARPAASAFGQDAYPTLREKAAALFHSVARNHPFADGNKRTATLAAILMLAVNGERVIWRQEEALERIAAVAEGRAEMETLAAWLPTEACEPAPEADAERDRQTIDALIAAQRWLLDELAKR
jgi:death-on-curing protein